MKIDKKRCRAPGFSLLASYLGKDARTIRRWIEKRPELRHVLRARRHGKQWRIDCPQDQLESEHWIEEVRRAVAPFTRTPERRSDFVKESLEFLGFVGEESERKERERDIEILRHALLLKRQEVPRHVAAHESEEFYAALDGEPNANLPATEYSEWEDEAKACWAIARSIAGRFKCSVEKVPTHWGGFSREEREKNRAFNAPKEDWLKAHGLYERAQQLLPEAERSGELVAFIGAPRADRKPRVKLYRFIPRWNYNRNGRWRRVFFQRETIRLLRVVTDEEIAADVSRVKELWPDPKHWQRARQQHERDWQLVTLGKAALELLGEGKAVTGVNLTRLLFCNQKRQDVWKSHQQHLELKRHGIGVFCDEETFCKHAKRGISLREFRQRYTRKEIAEATKKAEAARGASMESARNKEAIYGTEPAEDLEHEAGETNETGVGVRDERGEALTNATEKDKDFVSSDSASRVRCQFEQSQAVFDALTQEDRRKIEAALGRPLEDYKKKPFKEDFKPA
jgi:hypothetical protein